MLAATFDIGTTTVKAVVVNESGEPVFTGSLVIHTIETGNFKEQDPDEWYGAFCSLSKEMLEIRTRFCFAKRLDAAGRRRASARGWPPFRFPDL